MAWGPFEFLRSGPSSSPAPSRESSPSRGSPVEGNDLQDRPPPSGNCFLSGIGFPVDLSPCPGGFSVPKHRPFVEISPSGNCFRSGLISLQSLNPVQVNRSRDFCLYLGGGPHSGISSLYGSCTRSRRSLAGVLSMDGIKTRKVRFQRELLPISSEPPLWVMKHRPGEVSVEDIRILLPDLNIPGIASFPVKTLIRGTFLSGASPVWVSTFYRVPGSQGIASDPLRPSDPDVNPCRRRVPYMGI
jgi:hypothetical protein